MPAPVAPTVTARQLDDFAADGYLVLPGLVPAATIERLRADAQALLDRLLARMIASRTLDSRVTWWLLASGQPYVLKVKPVVDLAPSVATLAADPDLVGVVAELLGTTPRLMEDKFMYKQVVDVAAGWAGLPTLGEDVCKAHR